MDIIFEVIRRCKKDLELSINNQIKEFLSNYHLYQNCEINIEIDFSTIKNKILSGSSPSSSNDYDQFIKKDRTFFINIIKKANWLYSDCGKTLREEPPLSVFDRQPDYLSITINPETIHLYCANCGGKQPYNIHESILLNSSVNEDNINETFSLSYICQSCKRIPEVFLINRNNLKLQICGRYPIEKVIVPNYLPHDKFVNFVSGSIIAVNSGQILAGKFLLRTFIEQFVRKEVDEPSSRDIEKIFEKYNSKIDQAVKERFPSLRSIYEKLSEDIHIVNEDPENFNDALEKTFLHFDSLELFRKIK